jgi:hypothetical protein
MSGKGKGKKALWRYSVGTKGVNRVQVYERETGATIYIEWRDDAGRHQKALTALIGHPVTDRDVAKQIADRFAKEQEKKRNRRAYEAVFGATPGEHTLGELLEQLHADRGKEWSPLHAKDQRRFQKFWLEQLGRDLKLAQWSPALVERIVREAGDEQSPPWSPRTRQAYLRYIVDASRYARRKLKWIDEKNDLAGAVDVPQAQSASQAYSPEEIPKLLDALGEVDLRAAFVGEVAWSTGRRLNAIRTLTTDALIVRDDGQGLLQFTSGTDKAKRSGVAPLGDSALKVALKLLECPAVQATGLFCVAGDLSDPKPRKTLTTEKALIQWLHAAEVLAGIPVLPGRAYHGIKRRFSTAALSEDETAAEKQSGTNADTLRRHYVQDDLAPKIELARQLDAQRRAG